jgi:putative DNA primase/helicase
MSDGALAPQTRIRLSIGGKNADGREYEKFIWQGKGDLVPYGLWRLPPRSEREGADLYLVEGETDTLTIWVHQYIALGIPGAASAGNLASEHIAGFGRIILVCEDDDAGERFFFRE